MSFIKNNYTSFFIIAGVKGTMTILTEQLSGHIQQWLSSTDIAVKETLTRALQTRVGHVTIWLYNVASVVPRMLLAFRHSWDKREGLVHDGMWSFQSRGQMHLN